MLAEHDLNGPGSRRPKRPHSLFTMLIGFDVERALAAARRKLISLYPDVVPPLGPRFSANSQRSGGAGRDRTDDLMLAKQLLSQLSYSPNFLLGLPQAPAATSVALGYPAHQRGRPVGLASLRLETNSQKWWAWDDSNVRPHPYQGCALTT
jgi:hypothetical protein